MLQRTVSSWPVAVGHGSGGTESSHEVSLSGSEPASTVKRPRAVSRYPHETEIECLNVKRHRLVLGTF